MVPPIEMVNSNLKANSDEKWDVSVFILPKIFRKVRWTKTGLTATNLSSD
jgi:hypothetical protein